mgnify:FL=1
MTDAQYTIPAGVLSPNTAYSYRVFAFREPIDAEVDFYSANLFFSRANYHFTVHAASARDELVANFGPAYGLWHYDQSAGWKQWNSVNPSQMVTVDLSADGTDELVAAFPGYGLYAYDPTDGWQQINTVHPDKMIAADIDNDGQDELIAGFTGYGLYFYVDPGLWTQINTVVPEAMMHAGTSIVCDYGAAYGLWHYELATGWQQLNTVDPGLMLTADIDNDGEEEGIISFAGYGLYYYDETTGWQLLNLVLPDDMKPINFYS